MRGISRYLVRGWRDLTATRCRNPVFVLGNQKSGTSAIAALLGKATGRSVAIDLAKDFYHPVFHRVGMGDMTFEHYQRRNALEFSREIIKEANLTPMFNELVSNYEGAKFVFIVRHPMTNIRSILQRLDLPGRPETVSKEQLHKVSEAWRLILDSEWLGVNGDDYVTRLARRWQCFSDIAIENKDRFEIVRYEDFTKDKQGVIENLAKRLSLELKNQIKDQVEIQYQIKGDHRVSLPDFFGEANLAVISSTCVLGIDYFGYD